jgi:hypothetical protein
MVGATSISLIDPDIFLLLAAVTIGAPSLRFGGQGSTAPPLDLIPSIHRLDPIIHCLELRATAINSDRIVDVDGS